MMGCTVNVFVCKYDVISAFKSSGSIGLLPPITIDMIALPYWGGYASSPP